MPVAGAAEEVAAVVGAAAAVASSACTVGSLELAGSTVCAVSRTAAVPAGADVAPLVADTFVALADGCSLVVETACVLQAARVNNMEARNIPREKHFMK